MNDLSWLTFAQLVLGMVAAMICVCRLNMLGPRHVLRYRIVYCLLFTSSVAGSLGPWMFPETRAASTTLVLAALVAHLWLTTPHWRGRAPLEAESVVPSGWDAA